MGSTRQRGISLLVLIIMITVFAGVALGFVKLLRSRHESYPYQVQSYQAYTLAHAGIEFGIQYTKDNTAANGDFQTFLAANIPSTSPGREFNFGNGSFWLRYDPGTGGCNDTLYSRGTVGTATREVIVSNFGSFASRGANSALYTGVPWGWPGATPQALYISGPITKTPYVSVPGVYQGDQILLTCCDSSAYRRGPYDTVNGPYYSWIEWSGMTNLGGDCYMGKACPVRIAATKVGANQVKIMRLGVLSALGFVQWMWDAACGAPLLYVDPPSAACTGGAYRSAKSSVPWDGTTIPPPANQIAQFDFNTSGRDMPKDVNGFDKCRPQSPSCPTTCPDDHPCTDMTTDPACSYWTRSTYACGNPNAWPGGPPTGWSFNWSQPHYLITGAMPFIIQAEGPIPSGTKFYVSFWSRPHYSATSGGTAFNNGLQVATQVIFTVN